MKIFKILVPVILALFFLAHCSIAKKRAIKNITVTKGAIPPDFGKDEAVYVIFTLHGYNGYDRYVKKHAKEYYQGKYAFVLFQDIESDK